MKKAPTLLLSMMLSGCTVFPVPEPPRFMELMPASRHLTFDRTLPVSLRVDTPMASDPLDSARILIKPSAYEYQAMAGARWRESIPVVVRDHLIDTLRASGGFANVMTDTSPATADLTLVSEINRFQAQKTQDGAEVTIAFHLELMENRSRQSLCVQDYHQQVPASGTELEPLMEAFSKAANTASTAITSWAHRCMESQPGLQD